jgi:DNA-binding CsgD family transcriptional regulator
LIACSREKTRFLDLPEAAEDDMDETIPNERLVALQVAEGKTNKEAAAALFLSPKTIEFHLASVYRKLDLHSRRELIKRFSASGLAGLEPV